MSRFLFLLALLLTFTVESWAAYGWSGGRTCQPSLSTAVAERCSDFEYFAFSSASSFPLIVFSCVGVASVASCGSAADGAACSSVLSVQSASLSTGSGNTQFSQVRTVTAVVSACDLDYSSVASTGGSGTTSVSFGTVTLATSSGDPYEAFEGLQIDAENVLKVMAFGLGFVLMFWSFGFVGGLGVKVVKSL